MGSQKVCAFIFHRTWMAQESWWVWPDVCLGPPCYFLIVNPSHSGQCFFRDPWKHLEKSLYLYLFVCVGGGDSICEYVCNERVEVTDGQWVPSSYTCTPYMLRHDPNPLPFFSIHNLSDWLSDSHFLKVPYGVLCSWHF